MRKGWDHKSMYPVLQSTYPGSTCHIKVEIKNIIKSITKAAFNKNNNF